MAKIKAHFHSLSPNLQGAVLMCLACVAWVGNLSLVKFLSADYSPFMLAFLRAGVGVLVLAPIIHRQGKELWVLNGKGLMLLRGAVASMTLMLAYYSVSALPLSQFNAIAFSKPFFVIVIGILFLGERLGPRRAVASLVGFAGLLIVMQPSGDFSLAVLVALATALCASIANVLGKVLTRTNRVVTVLVYTNLLQALFTAPVAFENWTTPQAADAPLLIAMVLVGLVAQGLFIKAVSLGEISFVANFEFLRLPMTAFSDYVLFAIVVPANVWPGAALIISSLIYISWRESLEKRRVATRDDKAPTGNL